MNLPKTIREAIDRHSLIPDSTNVVLGVSGGADSVALLHAFHSLKIPCTVAHLNHGLRGAESDADEAFVRSLADTLGLPIVDKTANVQQLAGSSGQSIEMAARQARHDFFAEFENSVIALAHHADDQAETFILKLARGAGTEGLGGMNYAQDLGSVRLIRPMLNIPRSSIVEWLKENNISWREDASNSDKAFLRNRVRHAVLPTLEKELNPNMRNTILRTMNILQEENEWMESMISGSDIQDLPSLPLAAQRRILRRWLFENDVDAADFNTVDQILSLISNGSGSTTFELNDRQRVIIEYGIPRIGHLNKPAEQPGYHLVREEGTGWRPDHGNGIGIVPAEASFDAAAVGESPIEIKTYEPGDRMVPLGMQGTRKLQDIFTDQKIPAAQRTQVPVVVCRGEIIWIPGYRTARGWEVKNPDGKSIHVRIEQNRTN